MARIEGVDLPNNKRIVIALTYIFGVGLNTSKNILSNSSIDPSKRVSELSEEEVGKIKAIIEKDYQVEGDLRSKISLDIKRLMDIGSYRGLRHRKGLPVRGQKSKTNARTRKGRRPAVAKKK